MILTKYYNKSGLAQVYFKLKTGEELTRQEAANRFRMIKNHDLKVLIKALEFMLKEQKEALKK